MALDLGGSLVSGGASLLGGILDRRASAKAAEKQMDFQREMSNTAHQREVADLRAAGLNPILSGTGGQGASTPQGAKADNTSLGIGEAVNSAQRGYTLGTQKDLMVEQTRAQKESANVSEADAANRRLETPRLEAHAEVWRDPLYRRKAALAEISAKSGPLDKGLATLIENGGPIVDSVGNLVNSAQEAAIAAPAAAAKFIQQKIDAAKGASSAQRQRQVDAAKGSPQSDLSAYPRPYSDPAHTGPRGQSSTNRRNLRRLMP